MVFPLAASRQRSQRSLPSSAAAWTNTRSPQMMGDELPDPGRGTFQRTPSLSLQCTGMSLSAAIPVPSGPRKRGQGEPNDRAPANKVEQSASVAHNEME